jgi:hypothetical protein
MKTHLVPPAAAVVAFVCLLSGPSSAQWLNYPTPGIPRSPDGKPDLSAPAPKTSDGKPDLSGIWQLNWSGNIAGGYSLTNLAADLKPEEIEPWAEALFRQRSASFIKDFPGFRCLAGIGPLTSLGMLGPYKILQTPGVIAFLPEGFYGSAVYRQVLVDGRELPKNPNPTWQGYSIGHWEGDTLVVESAGFNDQTWLDGGGHPHTEDLRVTERFRRRDFGHLELKMTFNDPKAYARPWTISLDVDLMPDTELLEFVCNENERDLPHFMVTAEDQKRFQTNVPLSPEVLKQYDGVYQRTSPEGKTFTYTITRAGNQLMIQAPGVFPGKFALSGQSETTFSIFSAYLVGVEVQFVKDAQGVLSHLLMRGLPGGEQKAVRQGNTQ